MHALKIALSAQIAVVLLFLSPAAAVDFDCEFPPFGEDIASLNADGEFVEYDEREHVTYYRYTGKCNLGLYQDAEDIRYGFVGGRLYARFVDSSEVDMDLPVKLMSMTFKSQPKMEQDGDWKVYTWHLPEKDVKYKKKFNPVTKKSKTVLYYLPLAKKLQMFRDGD